MRAASFLLVLCAALGGCHRSALQAVQAHAGASPQALAFGETPVLFPVRRAVLLSNGGAVALQVTNPRVEGITGDQAAAFAVAAAAFSVSGGSTVELPVIFRPSSQASFAATLRFETDDPDHATFAIALSGTGTTSGAIAVRPSLLDFGRVGEGQTAARELLISSTGAADLYLASLDFAPGTPPGFALLGSRAPATVAAGSSVTIAVRYSPAQGEQMAPSALRVGSSDPARPSLDVPLHASINRAPIAVALGSVNGGAPTAGQLDTAAGARVRLDAGGSSDPDNDLPLRYRWTLASRPQGSGAAVADPLAGVTSITLDASGAYSVLLDVTDATGVPSIAPARLDVRALPPQALVVELVWDKVPPDLDLHFLLTSAARGSPGDCNWTNPDPDSFGVGPDGNPHHLGDKLTGYGPESVVWKVPADGDYRIDVIYKQDHRATDPATLAAVRVFAYGQQIAELRHAFQRAGDAWTAGFVRWPSATVVVAP